MTETVRAQRITVSTDGFSNPINLAANAEAPSHVKVYGDNELLQIGVDYTLDGVGDEGDLDEIAGVNVYIESAVLLADEYDTFTVEHDPPLDQETDISSGGHLGRVFEAGLDAIMRRVQALGAFAKRALRLPPDAQSVSVELPLPEDHRALMWVLDQDTGEWSLQNTVSDPDTEPLTDALAAADRAEAAQSAAESAAGVAQTQAQEAADAADRAEEAAANAGDLSALLNYLWPVGGILYFDGEEDQCPTYFLPANGQAVSRTTYAALNAHYAAKGYPHGDGDGSTTFNLPNYNGEGLFLRGAGGTAAALGVIQGEMIGPHSHNATIGSAGAHTHDLTSISRYGANDSAAGRSNPGWDSGDRANASRTKTTTSNGAHTHTVTISNNSGTENRPRNAGVLICIKY